MSWFTIADPKSIIDKENNKIILRDFKYPKNGYKEFVVSDNVIVINTLKRKGIVSEPIDISQISEIELPFKRIEFGNTLSFMGNIPKLWSRGIVFEGIDIFVALAVVDHIVKQRQDSSLPPLILKIAPENWGLREELYRDEALQASLKAKGVHF